MKRLKLSLAIIVKNEADKIADFISHHRKLVDEIVVVDTGSTDGTFEAVQKLGTNAHKFSWCDDFAAARNASIEVSSGDWILCLDADERIASRDFPVIRKAIEGPHRLILLPQLNYYDKAEHAEWQPVKGQYPDEERGQIGYFVALNSKLFPRDKRLRWVGRVHEDMVPSARIAGIEISHLEVPIHHYGYVTSDVRNIARNEFYGRLVRRKIEDSPGDLNANFELACALVQEGKALDSIPVLEWLDGTDTSCDTVARARSLLAKLRVEQGRRSEAEELLRRAADASPHWVFPKVDLIRLLADQERWKEMEEELDKAVGVLGNDPLLLKEKCRLLIVTGRIGEAVPVAREVARLFPSQPEYVSIADKCAVLAKKMGSLENLAD